MAISNRDAFPRALKKFYDEVTLDHTAAMPLAGGAFTGDVTTSGTFDGRDVAADGVTADAAMPKAGGAFTGDVTTSGTIDGRDVAADGVTADAALPKAGGAMTGDITTTGLFDTRDVAADGVTADAALPKAGGVMTGSFVVETFTVAGAPAATAGRVGFVSDETGGATLAYADGTNWKVASTGVNIA